MKPGNWIIRVVMWVMMLTIVAYFGVYATRFVFGSYETAKLYTFAAEDVVEVPGYIVREEKVLEGGNDLTAVIVSEGEKVAVGDTMAVVYKNEKALLRHQKIVDMEERLRSLQYIFSHSIDGADSAALNTRIVRSLVAMRKSVEDQELDGLPEQISDVRMMLFRRDYTYSGSKELSEEITSLTEQTSKLAEKNRSYTTTITTDCGGTFSGMVDGYEDILTPDAIKVLTPVRLDEMLGTRSEIQKKVEETPHLGKLVTGTRWYFVSVMKATEAQKLKLGSRVPVRLSSMNRTIDMKVESISTSDENKEVCAVFSTDRFLAEATLLRDQTADLIFDTVTGFRVPKSAIHVKNDSGEIGVYRVFGSKMRWIPVEIIWEDEDYYLIQQVVEKDEEGNKVPQTALDEARRLRDGAQIVTKGRNLYEGKVVSE